MVSEENVKEALKKVIDPELHLNIIELGLVYEIKIDGEEANIKMSLTSPGCPYGPQLLGMAKTSAQEVEGIKEAKIQLTFSPPWTPKMASEEVQAMFEQYQ